MPEATFRIWRGNSQGGGFQDYTLEFSPGMVVLDAVHEIQARQAGEPPDDHQQQRQEREQQDKARDPHRPSPLFAATAATRSAASCAFTSPCRHSAYAG